MKAISHKYLILYTAMLSIFIITGCSSTPPSGETIEISIGTLNDNIVRYAIDIHTGLMDTSTKKIIAGDSTGIKVPIDIETNRENKLFVLNQGSLSIPPTIAIFGANAEGNAAPEQVIEIGEPNFTPVGLTIAEGTPLIFVSYFSTNPSMIQRIIKFDTSGNESVFDIEASSLGDIELFSPHSVIYAVDAVGRQILKLNFNSSFDILPGAVRISGNNTGLQEPNSISLTTDGQIHVFDKRQGTDYGSIFIFPANTTGDIAPVRVLWNYCEREKTLFTPYGLAVAEYLEAKVILTCSSNRLITLPADSSGCIDPLQKIEISSPVSVAFDKVRF